MLFRLPRLAWVFPLATLLLGAGCAPKIGKACTLSTDCSQLGDRLCDTTQPGGYCTIFNCEPDTCPEAVCVGFDSQIDPACGPTQASQASRFERTFCMKGCDDDSDCRDGYKCQEPKALSATIVDLTLPSTKGICIAGVQTFSHCGFVGEVCAADSKCCSGTCTGGVCEAPQICGVTDPDGGTWPVYTPDGGASTSSSSSSSSSSSGTSTSTSSGTSTSTGAGGAGGAGGASGTSTGSSASGTGGAGGMGTATASSSSTG
jgi:hypothetical protein